MRTRSTGGGGMTRFGRSKTSIGGSVTIATSCPAIAPRTAWTAPASGRRVAPSRTRAAEGGPLACLRRDEITPLLAGEACHDHASHAHRPCPGQRLGVHSRADHEDRARRSDIEATRAQLAVGPELELPTGRTAQRDDA